MERIQTLIHRGKSIIYLDFSNLEKSEVSKLAEEAADFVGSHPENSCLTLTNITGLRFDSEIVQVFKNLTYRDKPYVKAGAILGMSGFQKVVYIGVMAFSKRNIPLFEDKEEALDWLASQASNGPDNMA
jgi:hypothetical protein